MIFELKEEHLKLLEKLNLQWAGESLFKCELGWISADEYKKFMDVSFSPYNTKVFEVYNILTGGSISDFCRCNNNAEIESCRKIYLEVQEAMQIVLQTRSFKLGKYKRDMNNVWSFLGNNMEKREIKFRFYVPSKNKMIYPTRKSDGSFIGTLADLLAEEDWVVMQYTGQQDKDDVDVYEGDILEFDESEWGGKDNIHVVSWDNNEACWCFGGSSVQSDMPFRKKIGNIYENPELLKFPATHDTYYNPF